MAEHSHTPMLPCPTCSSTGTETHEDRHAETRMDTCRTCGGGRFIPARTGETREASFTPPTSQIAECQVEQVRNAAQALLDACVEDMGYGGEGSEFPDADDRPVAGNATHPSAVQFGHLRRLRTALAAQPTPAPAGGGYATLTWDRPIELAPEAGRGLADQIMDAAWPEFGGGNLPADFWQAFDLAIRFTLEATRTPAGAVGDGPEEPAAPCAWAGGNDTCYCRTCGEEYRYGREDRPACPKAAPTPAGAAGDPVETDALVDLFATALKAKLRASEAKYGWQDGWRKPGWEAVCQRDLAYHITKGDPLDVAAYAAFCWHHGWPTWAPRNRPDETTGNVVPSAAGEAAYQARYPGTRLSDCPDWAIDAWNRVGLAVLDVRPAFKAPAAYLALLRCHVRRAMWAARQLTDPPEAELTRAINDTTSEVANAIAASRPTSQAPAASPEREGAQCPHCTQPRLCPDLGCAHGFSKNAALAPTAQAHPAGREEIARIIEPFASSYLPAYREALAKADAILAALARHQAPAVATQSPLDKLEAFVEGFSAAPAVDVPAERDRIARVVFDAFYDGPMGDEFDNPGYAHSRTLAEKAADAILATRPTDPGGARGWEPLWIWIGDRRKCSQGYLDLCERNGADNPFQRGRMSLLVELAQFLKKPPAASTASSDAGGAE